MHGRGLFTRNEPITLRDRCYLFIILLNVDRRGAKATGSAPLGSALNSRAAVPHCSEIFARFNEHAWASRFRSKHWLAAAGGWRYVTPPRC